MQRSDNNQPPHTWNKVTLLRNICIFCALNSIALPLVPFFFGKSYLEGVQQHLLIYAVMILLILIVWVVCIKLLNFDAKGPVPWYASPLVWFTPIFLAAMYSMFSV